MSCCVSSISNVLLSYPFCCVLLDYDTNAKMLSCLRFKLLGIAAESDVQTSCVVVEGPSLFPLQFIFTLETLSSDVRVFYSIIQRWG